MIRSDAPEAMIEFVESQLDPKVKELIRMPGVYVCGGVLRCFYDKTEVKDVDLYFITKDKRSDFIRWFDSIGVYEMIVGTDNAITYKHSGTSVLKQLGVVRSEMPKIQICNRTGSMEDILEAFDYTICQLGMSEGQLTRGDDTMVHIREREMHYNGCDNPLGALFRAFKYSRKGYHVSKKTLIDLLHDVRDIGDYDNIEEALIASGSY